MPRARAPYTGAARAKSIAAQPIARMPASRAYQLPAASISSQFRRPELRQFCSLRWASSAITTQTMANAKRQQEGGGDEIDENAVLPLLARSSAPAALRSRDQARRRFGDRPPSASSALATIALGVETRLGVELLGLVLIEEDVGQDSWSGPSVRDRARRFRQAGRAHASRSRRSSLPRW